MTDWLKGVGVNFRRYCIIERGECSGIEWRQAIEIGGPDIESMERIIASMMSW